MRVGFIGLGRMGQGMAANLQRAGVGLTIYDMNPDATRALAGTGAEVAPSLSALARQVDVVMTSLPRPQDVQSVLNDADGLAEGLRNGMTWLDFSTNSLDVVRDIAVQLADQGVEFLDAPISGGPAGAASGKLAIWVGGPRAAYDTVLPLLETLADRPRYVGECGAGTIAKLVHNTIATTINHAVAEMMSVGVKAGMEPLALYEAIRSGAMGRMRALDGVAPRWLSGKLDPATFALELLHKDVALGVDLAAAVDAPAPLATLARDDLAEAIARGWGQRDAQAALLLAQERAGIDPICAAPDQVRDVLDRT